VLSQLFACVQADPVMSLLLPPRVMHRMMLGGVRDAVPRQQLSTAGPSVQSARCSCSYCRAAVEEGRYGVLVVCEAIGRGAARVNR
jgi:hypothetical protein